MFTSLLAFVVFVAWANPWHWPWVDSSFAWVSIGHLIIAIVIGLILDVIKAALKI